VAVITSIRGSPVKKEVVKKEVEARLRALVPRHEVTVAVGTAEELQTRRGRYWVGCRIHLRACYLRPCALELHRTLRDGGRLIAITNASDHLDELRELVGGPRLQSPFSAENGKQLLLRHFRRVEVHDAGGTIEFPDRTAVAAYLEASGTLAGARPEAPAFEGPLVVTRHPVVFVADK
jgi:hypothetical protein